MKKTLAILLLLLGSVVTLLLVTVLTAVLFIFLAAVIPSEGAWVVYTLSAMLLFYASYPLLYLREFFKMKFNINAVVFTVCFCAPSLIAAVIAYMKYKSSGSEFGNFCRLFWLLAVAGFTFWTIVHACIEAYRIHRDKNA